MSFFQITYKDVMSLWKFSLPVIISQAAESLLLLSDRFLLSKVGTLEPSASMAGGLIFVTLAFFFEGILSLINAFVGQSIGAKKYSEISLIVTQGIILSFLFYPIMLIVGFSGVDKFLSFFKVPANETSLVLDYFSVLLWGSLLAFLKCTFSNALIAMGKSKIIMYTVICGLIVNIPLNYILITLGYSLKGAAFATIISEGIMFGLFCYYFFKNIKELNPSYLLEFRLDLCRKILKVGLPTGIEFFTIFFAFTSFITLFHTIGVEEALAITITLNWEILAFLPIRGLHISLVGKISQAYGRENKDEMLRYLSSGIVIALMIALTVAILYSLFYGQMINMFTYHHQSNQLINVDRVFYLASTMIKTVCIYLFFSGTNMVFEAYLRSMLDTKFCMYTSKSVHWGVLIFSYYMIHQYSWSAIQIWSVFVVGQLLLFIILFLRVISPTIKSKINFSNLKREQLN